MAKSHQVCHFYKQNDSSLGCRVNVGSHKSSEIQPHCIFKRRAIQSKMEICITNCFYHFILVKLRGIGNYLVSNFDDATNGNVQKVHCYGNLFTIIIIYM